MRMLHRCFRILAILALAGSTAGAAVFQYHAPFETDDDEAEAFLWIPPKASQVRGVIMAGMTLMEREFAKDLQIREACADQALAILFLKSGLSKVEPRAALERFAAVSGYEELSVAPLMFVGHSAGGPQAKARAVELADRCFGLVQYRGGGPWWGDSPVPPGTPSLMMVGQFDEFGGLMRDKEGRESWEGSRDGLASYRAENPRHLASIVIEPGAGHFGWSERNAKYLALFIRKAAEASIPSEWPVDAAEPVDLKQIDYRSGWLTDLNLRERGDNEPAAFPKYQGDKSRTAWHFDEELARATLDYHANRLDKKDQFIKWEDPHWVDAGTRFFFTTIEWVGDGQTFQVHPVYADKVPSQHNGRGPRWLDAGEPVGHADAPIHVKRVGGPLVRVGEHRLRVRFDSLAPATGGGRSTFMAYSEGDDEYRHTQRVGMMPRGFDGLNKGKEQTITFPPVSDLEVNGGPVPLQATSDAGLPVDYYVAYGPAKVVDGKLRPDQIPDRASYPMEVKVVAYQFGSGVKPRVKTAAPVVQKIEIYRSTSAD